MRIVFVVMLALLPTMGHAAGEMRSLKQCLVDATTGGERKDFARWIYVSMSKHPAMQSLGEVSQSESGEITTDVAKLFVDLLQERCNQEAQAAYEANGQKVYRVTGQLIGQLAMQELMQNKKVNSFMGKLGPKAAKLVDGKEILSSSE